MKRVNKPNVVWKVSFLALLLFSSAAVASAQNQGVCSADRVAGKWGYTHTGTIISPAGAVPVAIVGTITVDANGNFSGTQTSSLAGQISKSTLHGTATVNPDCTGTLTAHIYDQSGSLLRTVVWDLVYVDQAREVLSIATSLELPGGASMPAIMTGRATRMGPGRGNR